MKPTLKEARAAAARVRAELEKADADKYPNAWWFYLDRRDVETLLRKVEK